MVGERVDDRLRHGVDRAGRDQLLDVDDVPVVRVLGRRWTPTADAAGARRRRPAPASGRCRTPRRTPRRRAGRWRSRPCPERLGLRRVPILSSRLSISVSTRDTKNEATEPILVRSWPLALACSRPARNASITARVALQREDQRHVDADALGQRRGDRRQARLGRRDLDEQVRPVDQPPQRLGLGDGLLGLVRQPRVDLDGDPAVDAGRRVVRRPHHVAGPAHVVRGQQRAPPPRPSTPRAARSLSCSSYVVRVGERLGEDGRVGGHADDVLLAAQLVQRPPLDSRSRERSSSQTATPAAESSASLSVMRYAPCPSVAGRCEPVMSPTLASDGVGRGDDVVGGEAELLEQDLVGRAGAVVLDADALAGVADEVGASDIAMPASTLTRALTAARQHRAAGTPRPARGTTPGRASTRPGSGCPRPPAAPARSGRAAPRSRCR